MNEFCTCHLLWKEICIYKLATHNQEKLFSTKVYKTIALFTYINIVSQQRWFNPSKLVIYDTWCVLKITVLYDCVILFNFIYRLSSLGTARASALTLWSDSGWLRKNWSSIEKDWVAESSTRLIIEVWCHDMVVVVTRTD